MPLLCTLEDCSYFVDGSGGGSGSWCRERLLSNRLSCLGLGLIIILSALPLLPVLFLSIEREEPEYPFLVYDRVVNIVGAGAVTATTHSHGGGGGVTLLFIL